MEHLVDQEVRGKELGKAKIENRRRIKGGVWLRTGEWLDDGGML